MPVLSQSALASAWGPPCRGAKIEIRLNGTGIVTVRATIADAVLALDAVLREHDYRTIRAQTGAFACRHKVGASGWSNHSYGTALDLNWLRNPQGTHRTDMTPAMRWDIKRIRTNNGVQVWACGYDWTGLPDPMHIEICCAPRDIAHGIDPATVPDGWPGTPSPPVVVAPPMSRPAPAPIVPEEDDMKIFQCGKGTSGFAVLSNGGDLYPLDSEELAFWEGRLRTPKEVLDLQREWDLMRASHRNGQDPALAWH